MSTGILIVQLGTPDAPTAEALRPYLKQFLSDRRVIEVPKWKWWFILRLFILPFRPKSSAEKYQRIWDKEQGSPLLFLTERQTDAMQQRFPDLIVRFGMQVGSPSVDSVLKEMIQQGVDRLLVMPMYPQYSATTTASATDALFHTLLKVRQVPALRIVPPYYQHPGYLNAVTTIIQEQLSTLDWQPEHYLLSFHGIPISYAKRGDPYATHVKKTTAKLIEKLGWERSQWTQTFQSLFGREEWLKPYTEDKLIELAKAGVKKVFVATPGFTTDCLETLDEIGNEAKEVFEEAGGEKLYACPCLNEHPVWLDAMEQILREEGQGWL